MCWRFRTASRWSWPWKTGRGEQPRPAVRSVRSRLGPLLQLVPDLAQQQHVFRRCGRRCRLLLDQPVGELHHQEDVEGENDEIDRLGDELTIAQNGHARSLQCGIVTQRPLLTYRYIRKRSEEHTSELQS